MNLKLAQAIAGAALLLAGEFGFFFAAALGALLLVELLIPDKDPPSESI